MQQPPPKPARYGRRSDSLSTHSSTSTKATSVARAHTVPPRLADHDSNHHEIVVDTLLENQRGCYIYGGEPSFSAENLMPTDSPAWCDGGGGAQVDRMMYPTPHNWEWVTDWTLEVNGDVDPDGWTYSHHFNSKQWSGVCSLTHYVRRRSWSRTRRRTGFDASETHSESQSRILELPSLLRARPLDRQKLDLLQSTLFEFPDIPVKTYTVLAILNEFQFDKYRLQAAIGMLKKVPEEDVLHLLKPFRFHADKISVMEARKTL